MSPISRIRLALSLMTGLSLSFIAPVAFQTKGAMPLHRLGYANAQTAQTFIDVPADYWAHDYIEGLAQSNIISGFPDGTFKPNDPVTRAQFAAILRQAFLQSQPATAQTFKDVPANYWATGAIASARSAGFLSGYPDNTFKPNDRILRVQALVSLANGLKYPAGDSQSLSDYKDADTVPAYARPSITAAAQANLIVSYPAPDQISPNRAASRAEVAAFVYQALVEAGRIDPITTKLENRWQTTPIMTIAAPAYATSLSENGQRLAAITSDANSDSIFDRRIQVWDTQTGSLLKTFTAPTAGGISTIVDISPYGTRVAFITDTLYSNNLQLTVQDVESGDVLLTQSLNPPQNQFSKPSSNASITRTVSGLALSRDGKQVVTQVSVQDSGYDTLYNRLDFRDIATGQITQSIDLRGVDDNNPVGFIVSPDGNLLASLSADYRQNLQRNLDLWNLGGTTTRITLWQRNQSNRFDYLTTLPISKGEIAVFKAAFTTSNLLNLTTTSSLSNLIAEKPSQTHLETWNPRTAERVSSTVLPVESCVRPGRVGLSPDGTSYYSSSPVMTDIDGIRFYRDDNADNKSCFGDVQTEAFQRLPDQPLSLKLAEFSGDGNHLVVSTVTGSSSSSIQLFSKSKN